jgi:hypothetical protein
MLSPRHALALAGACLLATPARAQVTPLPTPPTNTVAALPVPTPPKDPKFATYGAGMRVNLTPDGSKYLRLISWTQVWTRFNENNANTLRAPNTPQKSQIDFGLRRARLLVLAQLNPRFLIISHFGINNQNAVSGGAPGDPGGPGKKPGLFLHDAVVEFKVNKYLDIGAGLHYQNGISRMTRASTLNFLAIDAPIINWPTIDGSDEFARFLGVYGKGRVGRLDYSVSANDPFLTNISSTPDLLTTNVAQYNPGNTKHVYQGYFSYSFKEQESLLLPYAVGTYLGTKRVLNIGAGFLHNADAMYARPNANPATLPANKWDIPTEKHNMTLLGADFFFDMPLDTARKTALTVYGVYYHYDFGPNYVRYVGALNPGFGAAAQRGNAAPIIGTGDAQYVQVGYLLGKRTLGKKARLQPYAAYMHANWDGLLDSKGAKRPVHVVDLGANLLLDGHNAKITVNYRPRPDFTSAAKPVYRNELTVQTVVFL